jgi:hypothetical protein
VLKPIVFCAFLALGTSGCGEGYRIDPARLLLTDTAALPVSELRRAIGPVLQAEGFEDFAQDEEMIALLSQSDANGEMVARLRREYTYLNKRRDLRVVVTDFTDMTSVRPPLAYKEPVRPFFEVAIYEERPGGFSSSGNQFMVKFQETLERSLGASVILVTPPPKSDNAEYWRITVTNFFAGAFQWIIAFTIALAITGGLSYWILKRMPLGASAKRGIFVIVNTWLATPLPFPAASILVILLPNLVAMPWNNLDYYRRVQDVAVFSFPIALIMCVLISLRMFRNPKAHQVNA